MPEPCQTLRDQLAFREPPYSLSTVSEYSVMSTGIVCWNSAARVRLFMTLTLGSLFLCATREAFRLRHPLPVSGAV